MCLPAVEQRGEESSLSEARALPVPPFPMLQRKVDFDAIARGGKARSNGLLMLRSLCTGTGATRIGIATPRTLGGAVQRNRVRRRLRELIRGRYAGLAAGWDLLVIARPGASQATYAQLREALAALVDRSGIGR